MHRMRSLASSTADEGVHRVCGKPGGEGYSFVSCFADQGQAPDRADENSGCCSYYDIRLTKAYPHSVYSTGGARGKKEKCSFLLLISIVFCFIYYLLLWSSFHFMSVTYIYLHTFSSILNLPT